MLLQRRPSQSEQGGMLVCLNAEQGLSYRDLVIVDRGAQALGLLLVVIGCL